MLDYLPSKTEEQLLPPNLRLNDDILSVHFNSVASNIKKRHSLCDANDSLTKYLSLDLEQGQKQQQLIQVLDDSFIIASVPDKKITTVHYENLHDVKNNINNDSSSTAQLHKIVESFISDTESEDSFTASNLSNFVDPMNAVKPTNNVKSLLKTSTTPKNNSRRVIFDPLALLLDAAATGELELVIKSAKTV